MTYPSADQVKVPMLSVVVMGYENAATIVESVRSILEQTTEEPFETVVVTSGDDDSAARVRACFPSVTVLQSPTRLMPGAARNAGVAAATGSHVAFLAADCEAAPGWVSGRQRAHAEGHRAVAGAMDAGSTTRPAELASLFLLFAGRLPGRGAGLVRWPDPAAHGLSMDKTLLEELGPFDPAVRGGEDTAAAERLSLAGVPIWFEPSVKTIHRGPGRLPDLLKDEYRRGRLQVQASVAPTHAQASVAWMIPMELAGLLLALRLERRTSWRNARSLRPALVAVAPWIFAGAVARRWGRIRALTAGEAGTAVAAMEPGGRPAGAGALEGARSASPP